MDYQEFNEEDTRQENKEGGEEDDFLSDESVAHSVSRDDRFSYGSSPGFKGKRKNS